MWPIVVLAAVLLMMGHTAVAPQDLYTCTTPNGATIGSNRPCRAGDADTGLPRRDTARPAPPPGRLPPPASPPLALPADDDPPECLAFTNLTTQVLTQNRLYVELSWQVDIRNRCRRPVTAWVAFEVRDTADFVLKNSFERTAVPSRGERTVQGMLLHSQHKQTATARQVVRFSSVHSP